MIGTSSPEYLVFYLTMTLLICILSEINKSHSFQSLPVIVPASASTPTCLFSWLLSDLFFFLQDLLEPVELYQRRIQH